MIEVQNYSISKVESTGCRVQGSRFRVQGSRFRVPGSRFKVQGSSSRFKIQGSRFTEYPVIFTYSKPTVSLQEAFKGFL
jgi:hypothetical protein